MRVLSWRSLLLVPADNEALLQRAFTTAADAVVLDLEDGVAAAAKTKARECIPAAARALAVAGIGVVVRINVAWRAVLADLEVAVSTDVHAIMVPKVEGAERLATLDEMMGEFEVERGMDQDRTGIVALIESPAALPLLPAIAASTRVIGLALGTEDFCLALGVAPTPAALDLPSRYLAAAAARRSQMALAVPISIAEFRDIEAYETAASAGATYGVSGAICIHPAQVKAANACFGVSDADREDAKRVLTAWASAQAVGRAVTSLDGRMIDLPVAERARQLLERTTR
jgi:citrate lyase subunit beta / citryl-CoA lyase